MSDNEKKPPVMNQTPSVNVEHYPNPTGDGWRTLVTIRHGISQRVSEEDGKLTKEEALLQYEKGAGLYDLPDPSNAYGYAIDILIRDGWIENKPPHQPLMKYIRNFENARKNIDLTRWESTRNKISNYSALVWAMEKDNLKYQPVWYAAQVLRHSDGPEDAHFVAGFLYRELTMRYSFEDDTIRGQKFDSKINPKTRRAVEANTIDKSKREKVIMAEIKKIDLGNYLKKTSGSINADKLARELIRRNIFTNTKTGMGDKAIAKFIRQNINSIQKIS